MYTHMSVHHCVYVHQRIREHVCVYVCVCARMHICACMCMHMCVRAHTPCGWVYIYMCNVQERPEREGLGGYRDQECQCVAVFLCLHFRSFDD